ncbi:unnamed protein product [Urochloa decumbens]|uniref:DUF6598 domain-containing protein n=1 Tax=Urochloa decumbens TaxID=240449 RepID=A0ABC9EST2_9POAL
MIGFGSSVATTPAALREMLKAAYAEEEAAGDNATSASIGCLLTWMNFHRDVPLEETTDLGPKSFTYWPVPFEARSDDTAQVYSVAVKGIKPELGFQWPLDVYGFVAVRDNLDCKRNIIFRSDRSNCQRLTAEESSLVLTGPSRAVLASDIMNFEIELKIKGSRESEDKILSFLVIEHNCIIARSSYGKLFRETHTNKYCTTELLFSQLRDAVEATIDVKVVEGSWSQDFCPRFVARTKSFPSADFLLFDSRESMAVSDEGTIQLSRLVVTVESDGELQLIIEAQEPGSSAAVVSDTMRLTPKRMGTTDGYFNINGFCKLEVCVSWSLLLPFL